MTDSHCHLYSSEFETDKDAVLARAAADGVEKFYFPAIDSTTHYPMIELAERYPGKCFSMIGLHPCSVKENYIEELLEVEKLLRKKKFVAIGETGLDFYWDKTFVAQQYLALEKQAAWALQFDLPLVLHTRNALPETIAVIQRYAGTGLKGIFHCFGGTLEEAGLITEAGFYLGIGGVVTYKNSGLAEVLKHVELKHLVLETDAPYLAPLPFRGKRNESSYLKYVAQKIADIKGVDFDEVDRVTTANAETIFKTG